MKHTHLARFVLASVLLLTLLTFASPAEAADRKTHLQNQTTSLKSYAQKLLVYMEMVRLMAEPADSALSMPVSGVLTSQVTDTWHGPRGGGIRQHEGQDIFAPSGTPVYSATRGIVTRVGRTDTGLGGIHAFVMGPGGRTYYYAHLNSLAKGISPGDMVTSETILGYVGNTGNARTTPPHLHFGMYTSRGAENPLPLMVNRKLALR